MRQQLKKTWQPVGAVYLLMCLAGLAVGLWPGAVWPTSPDSQPAPLPTLQCLAVSQVIFFLLARPAVSLWRNREIGFVAFLVELVGLALMTVPLLVLCSWFADATLKDCGRTVMIVAAFSPLGWVAGRLLRVQSIRGPVLLGLVTITLGLPAVVYIFREFCSQLSVGWLWRISPVAMAWDGASPRQPVLLAETYWYCRLLFWPIVAAAIFLTQAIVSNKYSCEKV